MQNRRVQNSHGVHSPVRLDGVQAEAAALEHRAGAAGARPLCSVRVWHAAIPTRREAAPCSLPSRTTEETVEEREMIVRVDCVGSCVRVCDTVLGDQLYHEHRGVCFMMQ